MHFSLEIGRVIHQTQIERGTTALYISSGGNPVLLPRLRNLYSQTDNAIDSLSRWIPLDKDHFESHDAYHEAIRKFRADLQPENATLVQVIGFYTRDNKVFIEMIGKSINFQKSVSYWTNLVAYQMIIMSKEQAGIERALGSTYFARGEIFYICFSLIYICYKFILVMSSKKESLSICTLCGCTHAEFQPGFALSQLKHPS